VRRWGAVAPLVAVAVAVAVPEVLAPHDPLAVDFARALEPPSWTHPLGTDPFGRCIASRIVHGARVTLGASSAALVVVTIVSVTTATVAALGPEPLRRLATRLIDLGLALPGLVLAVAVLGVTGPGLGGAVAAVTVAAWALPARLLRARLLDLRSAPFVGAAVAMGATPWRVATREVLPGAVGFFGAVSALALAQVVLGLSAVSFLGLGPQAPSPEWGAMLAASRAHAFIAPQLMAAPGLAITIVVGACTVLADDALDARDASGP
jgi:peptide/nickel transport system permease protein